MKSKIRQSLFIIILLFGFSQIVTAQNIKEEEKTFKLDMKGSVYIETYKGSIDIETWDKAEVYVYSKIEADTESWSDSKPEEQLENVKIKYDSSINSLHIQSKYDKTFGFFGSENKAFVHYKIKMPKTASVDIDDYKSETTIKNLEADIRMETYKGRVNISGLKGGIKLDTYKGDAVIDFADLKNNCSFDTFKGNIELILAPNSKFSLDIDIGRKGDFHSDFDYSNKGRDYDDDEIRGTVNGGGPYIEFETHKGDLRIVKK